MAHSFLTPSCQVRLVDLRHVQHKQVPAAYSAAAARKFIDKLAGYVFRTSLFVGHIDFETHKF